MIRPQKPGQKNYFKKMTSSTKNKKILILVLCSRNYLSKISSSMQKKIWEPYFSSYRVIHFVGKAQTNNREVNYIDDDSNDYLILDTDDRYFNLAEKTIIAFEEVFKNYDFDYVFRTNTSSYINFKKFEEYINNPKNNLDYSGLKLQAIEGDEIASGAGFFISRKNIKLIIDNKKDFNTSLPDDVAIARLLGNHNILPKDLIRRDLKNIPKPQGAFRSSHFHYRCRLDPNYHRILEPYLMKYLEMATNKNSLLVYLSYFKIIFIFRFCSNILIKKIIQKYYSLKFYGELSIGKRILYER